MNIIINEKLKHNFGELNKFEKIIYLFFIRPFQKRSDRIFFDGCFLLPGQMYKAERNALYRIIRETKPDYCFEIGTYTDGGSTFFISKALKDNNKGRLITMESDEFLHNKAKTRYKKYIKSQYPYIEFVRTSYPFIFEKYLQEKNKKIMISLDGAKDGKQTLEQYNYFLPYFHKGTILIAHDWNTEKTRLLKPLILNSGKWEIKIELRPPLSIGFIIAEML